MLPSPGFDTHYLFPQCLNPIDKCGHLYTDPTEENAGCVMWPSLRLPMAESHPTPSSEPCNNAHEIWVLSTSEHVALAIVLVIREWLLMPIRGWGLLGAQAMPAENCDACASSVLKRSK